MPYAALLLTLVPNVLHPALIRFSSIHSLRIFIYAPPVLFYPNHYTMKSLVCKEREELTRHDK